ncbi:MAG: PaaI family thioesterase [Firmicutes bacterium]|nr:PaaI family thioesterase [Bacillota bacterium]
MLDHIVALLGDMEEEELAQIYALVKAKSKTYKKPLAFLQAVMDFKSAQAPDGSYGYQMTITDDVRNRYGIVHGGVITTFIDTAMAETAFALDGHLRKAVTLHLTVNFVKAGEDGTLYCRVTADQNSHRIALFQAVVTDQAGDVVATADGHFYKSAHAQEAD